MAATSIVQTEMTGQKSTRLPELRNSAVWNETVERIHHCVIVSHFNFHCMTDDVQGLQHSCMSSFPAFCWQDNDLTIEHT